ncbi:MAG: YceD family protein [Bacteroidota bacterium]
MNKEHLIEFNKLKIGPNELEFVLNDAFFESIEGSAVKSGYADVKLRMNKGISIHELDFSLKGWVNTTCDNCLDNMQLPISNNFRLLMKVAEAENYADDEIVFITKNLVDYDLSQYLYECFVLSIPLRKVCKMANKKCNEEMIEHLSSGAEEEETEENKNNPMWDQLKGIFKNN